MTRDQAEFNNGSSNTESRIAGAEHLNTMPGLSAHHQPRRENSGGGTVGSERRPIADTINSSNKSSARVKKLQTRRSAISFGL